MQRDENRNRDPLSHSQPMPRATAGAGTRVETHKLVRDKIVIAAPHVAVQIVAEWASWPIRVKSRQNLRRRVLNGTERRQQCLLVAGIELNVVAGRRAGVETDRVGHNERDGHCLGLADGL